MFPATWSPEPSKTQNSPPKKAPAPAPVRTLRTSSPDFPDLNADGLEYLDLTNDAFDSPNSLSFSSDAKLWCEDYISRPNLVASSGKKRKSSEISEEEFSDLGDFPDIYELLGTYPPTPSPGSRSGTRRRDGSRSNQTRRTRDGFKNHLSTEISPISEEDEDDILSPSRYVHSPLAREQSPRKALPVIDTQSPSKGATSPLKESAVSSEASNQVHQTSSLPPRMEDGRDELVCLFVCLFVLFIDCPSRPSGSYAAYRLQYRCSRFLLQQEASSARTLRLVNWCPYRAASPSARVWIPLLLAYFSVLHLCTCRASRPSFPSVYRIRSSTLCVEDCGRDCLELPEQPRPE